MSSRVAVRELEAHEWGTYRDLRLRALADAPDAFVRTLAEEETRPDAEWARMLAASADSSTAISLVAELDARAVGLAYSRLDENAPEIAHLYAMWVDPAARRCGVGLALVRAVAAWARSLQARRVTLQVTETNAAAVGLYEQAGFVSTGERIPLRAGSALFVRTLHLTL